MCEVHTHSAGKSGLVKCVDFTQMKHRSGSKKNVIGNQMRKLRIAQGGITQDHLAGKLARLGLDIDRSAISRIESGERYVLDYEAALIAKALKVPIQDLYR